MPSDVVVLVVSDSDDDLGVEHGAETVDAQALGALAGAERLDVSVALLGARGMNASLMRSVAHSSTASQTNLDPLSARETTGYPRSTAIRLMTRSPLIQAPGRWVVDEPTRLRERRCGTRRTPPAPTVVNSLD